MKPKKTPARLLLEAALIWHAATVLGGKVNFDSPADKQLRRAAVRYLKVRKSRP